MDIELYKKIKKHNPACIKVLTEKYLKRIWFICWHITLDSRTAVPLLLKCWTNVLKKIAEEKSTPSKDFISIFSEKLLKVNMKEIKSDDTYASVEPPVTSKRYWLHSDCIDKLDDEHRIVWLINHFGCLNNRDIANAMGIPEERAKKIINQASSTHTEEMKKSGNLSGTEMITLSAEFTSSDGKGISAVEIPDILYKAIDRNYNRSEPSKAGKERNKMSSENISRKKSAKIRKRVITVCVCTAVIIPTAIFTPKLLKAIKGDDVAADIIRTYEAEEITYGDVDTTVSGSGSLSPVKSETISAPYPEEDETEKTTEVNGMPVSVTMTSSNAVQKDDFTVTEINISAGSEFAEGDVLAVITNKEDNKTTQIKAEYDGIVLEINIAEGDEISSGDEIALLMSKDGFEMNISVDEQDISVIKQGQESSVTVEALSEKYTGSVSSISYNGSSSGSSVSYQITVKIDYADGIYPAMSASAEIVIESSGEGMLVPVDAVQTSGDDSYVYLAPGNAESGKEYAEDEITLSELTKVTVETGMSDGSYILIESNELSVGDLIIITNVTSTLTGSDSDSGKGKGSFGGFGGFEGGMPPGNMDFGGKDFSNFDPSKMPKGGGRPDFGGRQ